MGKKTLFIILLCLSAMTVFFAQAESVRLSGWRVNYASIKEKKGLLELQKPNVELYSIMGFDQFDFPFIRLNQDKRLVECGVGTRPVKFLATNGFGGVAESYQFNEGGLLLSG